MTLKKACQFSQALAQDRLLFLNKSAHTGPAEFQKEVQFLSGIRLSLGSTLYFDKQLAAGHDDIHVNLRRGVLQVIEVQARLACHDPHAHCRDIVQERMTVEQVRFLQLRHGKSESHKRTGYGSGTSASIRLNHIAVNPYRSLSEGLQVDDGS
jgi:hypothetical protein